MEAAARTISLDSVTKSEDVAHLAVCLATPEAGSITGQVVDESGGPPLGMAGREPGYAPWLGKQALALRWGPLPSDERKLGSMVTNV